MTRFFFPIWAAALALAVAQAKPLIPTPTEEWVLQQLTNGFPADLADTNCAACSNRLLRAEFLHELFTTQEHPVPALGVQIANAVVPFRLDLQNAHILHEVRLTNCVFLEDVVLTGCELEKGLVCQACYFASTLNGAELVTKKSINLSASGILTWLTATNVPPIGAALSNLVSYVPGAADRALPEAVWTQLTNNGVWVTKEARILKLGEDNRLWLIRDTNLPAAFTLSGVTSKAGITFWKVQRPTFVAGEMDFRMAGTGGSFSADGAVFSGTAHLESIKVGGTLWLDHAVFLSGARLGHASVGDDFSLAEGRFLDPVNAANFYHLAVGGLAKLDGTRFSGPVNFIQTSIKGNFQAHRTEFLHTNDLSADPDNEFHHNADFGSLQVDGFAFFLGTRFDGEVSFRNARFSNLYLDEVSWPTNLPRKNVVRLEWMRFERIRATSDFNTAENNRSDLQWQTNHMQTWHNLRTVLAERSPYIADVYEGLEKFFQNEGQTKLAKEVFIESKQQERRKILNAQLRTSPWRDKLKCFFLWIWNWIFQLLVGYGRHPERALIYSSIFVAVGCAVFRRGQMGPVKDWPATDMDAATAWWDRFLAFCRVRSEDYTYYAFWYSLDMFVPFIELHANEGWQPKPKSRLAWNYLVLHRIAGAILIPIGFAAFSGILK